MNNVNNTAAFSFLVARIQKLTPQGRAFFAFNDLFDALGVMHSLSRGQILNKSRNQIQKEGLDPRKIYEDEFFGPCAPMSILPSVLYCINPVLLAADQEKMRMLAIIKAEIGVEETHPEFLRLVQAESYSPFADEPVVAPVQQTMLTLVTSEPEPEVIHTPPVENSPHVFGYLGKEVRVVMKDGERWWVAKDVCEVLGIAASSSSLRALDEDEKGVHIMHTLGGDQKMAIITEPGLYSLIGRSKKPAAKAFMRWVRHDVIPSIRKTGSYSVVPQAAPAPVLPKDYKSALLALVQEVEKNEAQEAVIRELAPKAEFHDTVAESSDDHDLLEVAKVLGSNIGRTKLIQLLREKKIFLVDRPLPYQEYINSGYFRVCETPYTDEHGKTRTSTKAVVTGKGLTWLEKKLKAV